MKVRKIAFIEFFKSFVNFKTLKDKNNKSLVNCVINLMVAEYKSEFVGVILLPVNKR